jgi:hypothetical protein
MLENASAYQNLALSPDGEWLAAGNQAWDLATGKVISAERYGGYHDFGIAISPDGQLLARVGDGEVLIWEKRTIREIHALGKGGGMVNALAFSPDGTVLVAAGDTGSLVWDMTGLLGEGQRRLPKLALEERELGLLWESLAAEDGWAGHRAAWKLATGGQDAVAFIGKRLRPVGQPDADRLATLRATLTDQDFDKRELAARGLVDLGIVLTPDEIELTRHPDKRAISSAFRFDDPKAPVTYLPPPVLLPLPERVCEARAIAALERSRHPTAATLLEKLAAGHQGAPLTREAGLALKRVRAR